MSSRKIEPNESKFGMNGRRKAVDSLKEKEDPRFCVLLDPLRSSGRLNWISEGPEA